MRRRTDKPTVLNLTDHSYFNLDGNGSGSALDQLVQINADAYTPDRCHPDPDRPGGTGRGDADGLPHAASDQRRRSRRRSCNSCSAHGYDHNWVLNKTGPRRARFRRAGLFAGHRRVLDVFTTEPGLQFYTGNYLDGSLVGSAATIYRQGDGYTFETQHFPDLPNHPNFPTTRLDPGQTYRSTTIFRFSTDN